jgi:copper transport protein
MSRGTRLALALALLLCPTAALAHAHLKRSEPAAGSRITSSPQWIRLWFTERPELSMTAVSIKDASGNVFALASPEVDRSDPLLILVPVAQPLPAGQYTVTWRTAASDGHPSRGTFGFVVLTDAAVSGIGPVGQLGAADTIRSENASAASSTRLENVEEADASSSITNSLARAFSFVGLLVLIGATIFRTLVLRGAREIDTAVRVRMEQRTATLGLAASVLVILGAIARVSLMSEMMSTMPEMHAMSPTEMVMHSQWGLAVRLEIGAALVALASFGLALRRVRGAWVVATIVAMLLAVTPALAGHAAASPRFTSLMIATDFLHVLGGGSWLGNLLVVMVVGVPVCLTCDGAERWSSVASLVNSFSPIALASAALVVTSGVIASWVHLETLSALWQTAYGQVLLLKVFLVVIALAIGAYNFRRVQPQLANELGSTRLRRSAGIELSVGFLILLVTGFLTGISP